MRRVFSVILASGYARNSTWAVIGSFSAKALTFASTLFMAKVLGPTDFGAYSLVQTTIGVFGTLAGLGLGLSATKLIAECRSTNSEASGELIATFYLVSGAISFIFSFFLFVSSSYISEHLLNNSELTILLQLTALVIMFDTINGVQTGLLFGYEMFRELTLLNALTAVGSSLIMVLGVYFYGMLGAAIALLISRLCTVLLFATKLNDVIQRSSVNIRWKWNSKYVFKIVKFSIPAFLCNVLANPINWVGSLLFVQFSGGYSQLGIYTATNQLRQLVLFLPDSAGRINIPQLTALFSRGKFSEFAQRARFTVVINLGMSLITALVIFPLSDLLLIHIGDGYLISSTLVLLVLGGGVVQAISNAIGYVFLFSNKIWIDVCLRVGWGVTFIVSLIWFGASMGAVGYALASFGSLLFFMAVQFIIAIRQLKKFQNI